MTGLFESPGSISSDSTFVPSIQLTISGTDMSMHSDTVYLIISASIGFSARSCFIVWSYFARSGSVASTVFAACVNIVSAILFSLPLCFVCKLQKARRKDTSRRLCGIVPVNKKLYYCLLSSFLIWKVCQNHLFSRCLMSAQFLSCKPKLPI